MSNKKPVVITVICIIAITVAIVLICLKPWERTYTLNVGVSPPQAGSVSPVGGKYKSGTKVTVTANPTSGYTFDNWSGNSSGNTSAITIIMDSDKDLIANFKAIPTVSVDYEATILADTACLSVSVEGSQDNYDIILLDPAGKSVGYGFISSDDMTTGHKIMEVSMTGTGVKNPRPGKYSLIVKVWPTDEKVVETKPVFKGPDVSITNVQFITTYDECLREGDIDEVIIQVYNGGDLPVFPDEIKLWLPGKVEDVTIYESLPHGETIVIDCFVRISGLGPGTHRATVAIYAEGVKLASYATQVEIG